VTHSKHESRSPQTPATLARRVSGWTSNLLATGIVLAAAVGVGRQVTHWWRIDPADASAAGGTAAIGPGAVGDQGEQPFELTFGGGYSLRRIELKGDLTAAVERLRQECRTILESGRLPTQPPNQAEQRFLDRAADRTPLEERSGQWQIHRFDSKLPLLVAVVDSLRESTAASLANQSQDDGRNSATPSTRGASRLQQPRVVAWGLAMPTDEEACTLLVYDACQATAEGHWPPDAIELPPGWRRTLTLRGQGETSIGLAGSSPPDRGRGELDAFFSSRGWAPAGWRQAGAAWHNRYQARDNRAASIHVQLSDDGRGGTVGLLIISDP
jgi:hypothetical protein